MSLSFFHKGGESVIIAGNSVQSLRLTINSLSKRYRQKQFYTSKFHLKLKPSPFNSLIGILKNLEKKIVNL